MRRALPILPVLAGALALMAASPVAAVTIGQVDDFEDGTTQGWVVAIGPGGGVHPAPPVNIATGGPQGADDNFLQLTAVGNLGPGGRLSVLNPAQWAGDYLAAGVAGISMWVNNFGDSELMLRLLFEDPIPGPPANVAISADPIAVAAGSGWRRIAFPILPGNLIAVDGTVEAALSGATVLRLIHAEADTFPGETVATVLGVDDITAQGIPEPAAWTLMIAGFGVAGAMLRRRAATA